MKSTLRHLLPLCGFAAALPAFAEEKKTETIEKKHELRVISGDAGAAGLHHLRQLGVEVEKQTVAYLGVVTGPVSDTVAAQLGLPEGAGLVVNEVAKESPAADVLKRHDIIFKIDDQILIEPRQFSVLIRQHKKGDEVTLTFLRGGKQTTAKVKLGEHEVPKIAMATGGEPFGQGGFKWESAVPVQPGNGPEMDRVLALIQNGPGSPDGPPGFIPRGMTIHGGATAAAGAGFHGINVNTGNSNMVFSDEQGSLDLTIKDGKKSLLAKDPAGKELFSGPIDTPEQRKALPETVRGRLDKLEGMQDFSFKVDGDFKGADVRVVVPKGRSISLPSVAKPLSRGGAPVFF